jgi:hypothetical protein
MRKLMCQEVRRPAEIGIEVVMPAPSNVKTTRERFAVHSSEPGCAGCHQTLDAIGFAFEGFDAMGGARQKENGRPVDTSFAIQLFDEPFESRGSLELSRRLAGDPRAADCFARHAFRYFSAQDDASVEASFLRVREELDEQRRESLLESLVAYVASDLFVEREVRP